MYSKEINRIAQLILEDKCIFFVGAGLSAINGTYPSLKDLNNDITEYLSERFPELAEYVTSQKQELIEKNFPVVIDKLFDRLSELSKEYYHREVKTFVNSRLGLQQVEIKGVKQMVVPINEGHKLIALTGIRTIYTTNYDHAIEDACLKNSGHCNVLGISNTKYPNIDYAPSIIKLYGSAGDDNIIVSQKQFDAIPGSIKSKHPDERTVLRNILSALIDSDKHIVFVGYSLRDSVFGEVFDFINENKLDSKIHFAVARDINDKYDGSVNHLEMNILEFLLELRKELMSQNKKTIEDDIKDRLQMEVDSITELERHKDDPAKGSEFIRRIEKIKEANLAYQDCYRNRNWSELPVLDFKFHMAINSGKNREKFAQLYFKIQSFVRNTHSSETHEQHERITDLLCRYNFEEAANEIKLHLSTVEDESKFWVEYFNRLDSLRTGKEIKDNKIKWFLSDGKELVGRIHTLPNVVLLLGEGGTGKTTFLIEFLIKKYLNGLIPIIIDFRIKEFAEIFTKEAFSSLPHFINTYCKCLSRISNIEPNTTYCADKWEKYFAVRKKKDDMILLIDGLDSVSDFNPGSYEYEKKSYKKVVENINRLILYCKDSRFKNVLITSRVKHYDEFGFSINAIEKRLSCLNDQQIADYIKFNQLSDYKITTVDTIHKYYPDNMTFILLDVIKEGDEYLNTEVRGNISVLYQQFCGDFLDSVPMIETDINDYRLKAKEIIIDVCKRMSTKNFGKDYRVMDHPSFEEFFISKMIANNFGNKEFISKTVINIIENPRDWPILFFLAGLIDNSEIKESIIKLIYEKIANSEPGLEYLLIRFIRNLRIEAKLEPDEVLSAFLRVIDGFDIYGQIPTPEVAREFQHIGSNGIATLQLFLAEKYYSLPVVINNSDTVNFIVKKSKQKLHREELIAKLTDRLLPDNLVKPTGMLRRAAVDCLGKFISDNKVQAEIFTALDNYIILKRDSNGEEKWKKNEFEHNIWHLCIALNQLHSPEISSIVNEFYERKKDEVDTITCLELLYHLWKSNSIEISQDPKEKRDNTKQNIIADKICRIVASELPQELEDKSFLWRRAHASGVVERLIEIDHAELQRLLHGQIYEKIKKLATKGEANVMVRYYASITLGKFLQPDALTVLVNNIGRKELIKEFANANEEEQDSIGWIIYASLCSINELYDHDEKKRVFSDRIWGAVSENLNSFICHYQVAAKPKIDDLSVGMAIKMLGKIAEGANIQTYINTIIHFKEKLGKLEKTLLVLGKMNNIINTALVQLNSKLIK